MTIEYPDHTFHLWAATASHDQLLLRSTGNGARPRNVDITFVGVRWLELSTLLRGVVVTELPLDRGGHVGHLPAPERMGPGESTYLVRSEGRHFRVVAVTVHVREWVGDYFAAPEWRA